MARTNRKDGQAPAPAPASVDALDDLNLDDMFEGGDDSLFDGLDIDLDGMGEITGADDKEKKDAKMSKDLNEMKMDLLGPDGTGEVVPSSSKRRSRKTKRKTAKALPSFLEEDDLDDEPPVKKKKRSTKSSDGTKKTKKTKNSAVNTKTKAKNGNNSSSTSVIPTMSRASSNGESNFVAAAGQFGGRTKKGAAFPATTLTKPTTDKQKSKSKASRPSLPTSISKSKSRGSSNINVTGNRGNIIKQEQQVDIDMHKTAESTYCGIDKGKKMFYPFLPALPAEASMKKCHKLYSCMDKIHSAVSGHGSSNNKKANNKVSENDALFRLIFNEVDNNSSQSAADNKVSAQTLRKAALASAIASSREVLSQTDKAKLASELRSVCGLLKRQYDFLNTSMDNMERWCRDNFSSADHALVYGQTTSSRKRKSPFDSVSKDGTSILGRNAFRLGRFTFKKPVIRVKIKCGGFKEPKVSSQLTAHIPGYKLITSSSTMPFQKTIPNISATASKSKDSSKSTASKKRKAAVTQPVVVAPALTIVEDEFIPYTKLKPSLRRQRIAESVARQAQRLEMKYTTYKESRRQAFAKQQSELRKVVLDDELLLCNTTALWKWVEKSSYFADYTEDDIDDMSHHLWQPELNHREMFWGKVPTLLISKAEKTMHKERAFETKQITQRVDHSSKSLYNRLQSLLVDEGLENDTEEDDTDDDEDEDEDEDFVRWREIQKDMNSITSSLEKTTNIPFSENCCKNCINLDISNLNLEERTYVQLRSMGLVDTTLHPSTLSGVVEADSSSLVEEENNGSKSSNGGSLVQEETLSDVIRAMQKDLSRLHRVNNSRTALLQSVAKAHLSDIEKMKKKEEENMMLVAKYNHLMKKQKEIKRSSRQITKKKTDEEWVPW